MRNYALAITAIAVLVVSGIVAIPSGNSNSTVAVANETAPKISVKAKIAGDSLERVAFSSDGGYVVVVDKGSSIRLFSSSGKSIFTTKIDGANKAVVAPGGKHILAFSHMNVGDRGLSVLDSHGKPVWKMHVSGAIWSADACRHKDCSRFVVGTGERYIYVLDIDGKRRKFQRWRTPGVVVSVQAEPSGEEITFGTWQESHVIRADIRGEKKWILKADSASLPYIKRLKTADRMLVRTIPNASASKGAFVIIDNNGDTIWQGDIRPTRDTVVKVSPNGRFVCVGYDKIIKHKGKSVVEKHAALYDSNGKKLCDKGSLILPLVPLSVTSSGHAILNDGKNGLFTMDESGELSRALKLPSNVNDSICSTDGSRMLVACSDDNIYFIRIVK